MLLLGQKHCETTALFCPRVGMECCLKCVCSFQISINYYKKAKNWTSLTMNILSYLQEAADLSHKAQWNLNSNVVTQDDQSSNGCVQPGNTKRKGIHISQLIICSWQLLHLLYVWTTSESSDGNSTVFCSNKLKKKLNLFNAPSCGTQVM